MAAAALQCAVGSPAEVQQAFTALLVCLVNPLTEHEYLGKKKKKNHKAGNTLDDSMSFVPTTKRWLYYCVHTGSRETRSWLRNSEFQLVI